VIKNNQYVNLALFFICITSSTHALTQIITKEYLSEPSGITRSFSSIGQEKEANVSLRLQEGIDSTIATSRAIRNYNLNPSDTLSNARGVRDAALFKSVAPSVVLIATKDSLGTGSLINSNGDILTNWHVVGKQKIVQVIFKPIRNNQKITDADVREGVVIKIDQRSDLALIRVKDFPVGRLPIKVGTDSDVGVGIDVHAIGHPRGEAWTYTKGIVSQIRNEYKWGGGDSGITHQATVIQTQTPINPGNSGGPLFIDNGVLIGVNSFKEKESEGLNFAVSADEVKAFLTRPDSRVVQSNKSTPKKDCDWKLVFDGESDDKTGTVKAYDTRCDGTVNVVIFTPSDTTKPVQLEMDRNLDGKVDIKILSFDRDLKWDISLWDDNYDSLWDKVGYHKEGELIPYRFESYSTFSARAKK
jgi:S1-C subfamily serine protease